MNDKPTLDAALRAIVGEKLSSVTFALNFWQLDFDGHRFTVWSRVSVKLHFREVRSGQPHFRDRLCEQIAKVVRDAGFEDGTGVTITFEDASSLELSSREKDYAGPEAIMFNAAPPSQSWFVV